MLKIIIYSDNENYVEKKVWGWTKQQSQHRGSGLSG